MRTTVTVLGVSAGVVTAEQLARVAVSAAGDGRQIAGILVADPDPTDHTTRPPPAAGTADAPETTGTASGRDNGEHTVSNGERTVGASLGAGDDLAERLPVYDGFAAEDEPAAEYSTGISHTPVHHSGPAAQYVALVRHRRGRAGDRPRHIHNAPPSL